MNVSLVLSGHTHGGQVVLSLEHVGEGAGKLPTDERNLAWRAAELMAEHVGRAPDVSILTLKRA